jgi:glutamate synthase (NADPH/NADH) large chain/glutamate synthase (ferredoxin)
VAARVLGEWDELLAKGAFVKVMPHDYKRVLRELAQEEARRARRGEEDGAGDERPLDAVGGSGA